MYNFLISLPGGAEWLLVLFGLLFLVFWVMTIIDVVRSTFKDESTKIVWLLVVILLGVLGALIYRIAGTGSKVRTDI